MKNNQREQLKQVISAAWAGKLKWVDAIIIGAGYIRADFSAVSSRAIGGLYGVSSRSVGLWHSKSGCPRNADEQTYNVAEVIRWHERWKIDTIQRQNAIDGSPGIERLRLAKAKREEIALERDRGNLLPREAIHEALGRLAIILRGAGADLGRKFGADAQAILDECLDDFMAEAKKTFASGKK